MTARTDCLIIIKDKLKNFNEEQAIELEKAIYNWSIEFATSRGIIKNWKNPVFARLYLEKARTTLANLDNPRLEERLLKDKEFMPRDIPFMKPENLHPQRWQDTIERHMKRFEYAYENKKVATTDQFKCGKCKKRECTFYTMQTRSCDEPESIFIRCVNCGHQWRQ
jgi:DNA-directed RNA polymerase subunit M/transcription elongation factor TFIIS